MVLESRKVAKQFLDGIGVRLGIVDNEKISLRSPCKRLKLVGVAEMQETRTPPLPSQTLGEFRSEARFTDSALTAYEPYRWRRRIIAPVA